MKANNLLLWASLWATAVKGYNLTFYDSPKSDCTGKVLASDYQVSENVCDTKFRDSGVDVLVDPEDDEADELAVEFYSDASCKEPIHRYMSQPSCTGSLLYGSFKLVKATEDPEPSDEQSEVEKRADSCPPGKKSPFHGQIFDDEEGGQWVWQQLYGSLFVAHSATEWHRMRLRNPHLKANTAEPPIPKDRPKLSVSTKNLPGPKDRKKRDLGLNSLLARTPPTSPTHAGPSGSQEDCYVVPREGPLQELVPPNGRRRDLTSKEVLGWMWDQITRAAIAARMSTHQFVQRHKFIAGLTGNLIVGIISSVATTYMTKDASKAPETAPSKCPNWDNLPPHYATQYGFLALTSDGLKDKGKKLQARFEGTDLKQMDISIEDSMTCGSALSFLKDNCELSENLWTTKQVTGE